MKVLCLFVSVFLAQSPWAQAAPFTPVIEFKIADAQKEKDSILLPDKTGNGYDLLFSGAGAMVDNDPDVSGRRALAWSGTSHWPRCQINCLEMPNLVCFMKVKPAENSVGNSDIMAVSNSWIVRYLASKKKFALYVFPGLESPPGKTARIDLELPAKSGEWNELWMSINADRIDFRVNDLTVSIAANMPQLKVIPIRNGAVQFFRPDGGARFIGSLGDISVGFKPAETPGPKPELTQSR